VRVTVCGWLGAPYQAFTHRLVVHDEEVARDASPREHLVLLVQVRSQRLSLVDVAALLA